jgi:hypothetical protein
MLNSHLRILIVIFFAVIAISSACLEVAEVSPGSDRDRPSNFGEDIDFLRKFKDVVLLSDKLGLAQVAVVPDYQGRVMSSTAEGRDGPSFGWINYELIESGNLEPHVNFFGGEDRFWMGPEGGQFSIFFKSGDPFDLEHWQTPEVIDTLTYEIVGSRQDSVSFRHQNNLVNYSGTVFNFTIDRQVRLLSDDEVSDKIGTVPSGSRGVAYESVNRLTNRGPNTWTREEGLLSIWILGMFRHSPVTTVVIPIREGEVAMLGPVVNDSYFGKVPEERLAVVGGHIFFKADGAYRSKIGVSPSRATGMAGSYNAASGALTLTQYDQPEGILEYVNSMWEIQAEPFSGDAINSYNDGPPSPEMPPMGPFYELETSSPAVELEPGDFVTHRHRTMHFTGSREVIEKLSQQSLGLGLDDIVASLP